MTAAASHKPSLDQAKKMVRLSAYWFLKTLGWASTSLACVTSLNVLFFVMLGNFTIEGLLYQLDNFGSRYLAADSVRRSEFGQIWLFTNILLFAFVCLFRRHSLFTLSPTAKEA